MVRRLGLIPHPEGGFYRETFRSPLLLSLPDGRTRSASTAIYYLLPPGAFSAWHQVASDEVWHHYAGGPLRLTYFVASLGPDRQILSKPLFDTVTEFPEGQQRAGSSQEITVHMPGVTPATGPQYSVFVGFQLDDAEMRRRFEDEAP